MATIWEKAISILVGNLNSGHSYHITAVTKNLMEAWTGTPILNCNIQFWSDSFCYAHSWDLRSRFYLIVAAKIFKILSNFSSPFFLLVKNSCIDLRPHHWSQTKFLEGVGSPELNKGVSKCVEQFFARELLTWFPLKEDAKEVTVLFETLRDTLLLVVIVVMLFILNVWCLKK